MPVDPLVDPVAADMEPGWQAGRPLGEFITLMAGFSLDHLAPFHRCIEAARHSHQRCVFNAPPRFGKSYSAAHGIAWMLS